MRTYRVFAGTLAATLIFYAAVGPGPIRAQITPFESPAAGPGCGGSDSPSAADKTQAYVVGDLNGDSHVDVVDLLIFVETWAKMFGDPGFNPEADFNCDGAIDTVDLLYFVENFGT